MSTFAVCINWMRPTPASQSADVSRTGQRSFVRSMEQFADSPARQHFQTETENASFRVTTNIILRSCDVM